MARLSNAPSPALRRTGSSFERSSAELGQLLSRLQQVLLHPDPNRERQLRTSEYERSRQKSNLDYARATLTKLEQDALGVLAPGRRVEVQTDLNKKRELLDVLVDRLQDLQKLALVEEDEEDSSDVDDALANLIPTPSESTDTQQEEDFPTPDDSAASVASDTPSAPPAQPSPTPQPFVQDTPTQTQQTLRSRSSAKPTAVPESPDNPPAHATARAALFANRRNRTVAVGAQAERSTATAEAILDVQSKEREELADKVFQMAQAMKNQQKNIAASLESEKDVLTRATEGMERTGRGMDIAKGRMGALQKMSEGKGWWGRMMLFAWVYGLMIGLLVLVFVLPKLRF
ncbi:unnamed protein product [Clonostachys byssicola]|uniref:Synaptobrevin n=1 Tax=Clonostachys byssicola TaxID=160290 RepID=A0A9N9UQC9_9HYPO|nr:unnamed protein product [Clonostachys byssicola]